MSQRADVRATFEDGKLRVTAAHFGGEMDLSVDAAPEVEPGNVACAVAAALSLGVPAPNCGRPFDVVARRPPPAQSFWPGSERCLHYRRHL